MTVNTGAGCYWSALSSQGFVQEGAILSGSGTESVGVDINLSNQPRSISINVQGQIVTVLQTGMPLYTSTGSFSVIGIEGKDVVTSCNSPAITGPVSPVRLKSNLTCPPRTYYDTGTVTLLVGGNSFSAAYSSTSTKQTVVNDLISTVNRSGSLRVGTLGALLVIVSLNGSATINTDYSLGSFSTDDDPALFPHPSFNIALPATSMTGNP